MTTEYLIRLPWPDKALSSNARTHWAQRSRATKKARHEAWALCKEAGARIDGPVEVAFAYFPPDRRKRDAQNMPAMLKAFIDGIADALGVDDAEFRVSFPKTFDRVTSGGCVLAHIREAQPDTWKQIGDLAQGMVRGAAE